MKEKIFAILVLGILLFSGCLQNPSNNEKPIGGDRDEHGCLIAAGYSWNESVGACIREWELDDSQKNAAKIAVDYVGWEKGTTIIEVIAFKCPGCFDVKLKKGTGILKISLWNLNVSINDFEDCANAGNPVMESYPRQCRVDGKIFFEEIENAEEHVCTKEEKQAEICTMEYAPVCGDDGITYGNGCSACASGEIESYASGECKTKRMDANEARQVAQKSDCIKEGNLTEDYFYNNNTMTWWFNLDTEKPGCAPACVVSEETNNAEINWRCTGLITPDEESNEQLVGNDRDEHGCIGSAGYSWCEAKQKCLRAWEEECQ